MSSGVDPGVWVLTAWKYVGGVRVCFDPLKCHILSFKTCWITKQFHIINDKKMCQKWKVKLIFWGFWNSLMAWPDWPWPPYFTTDLHHCRWVTIKPRREWVNELTKIGQDDIYIYIYKFDTNISKILIFPPVIRYDISISNRYFDIFDISKQHCLIVFKCCWQLVAVRASSLSNTEYCWWWWSYWSFACLRSSACQHLHRLWL